MGAKTRGIWGEWESMTTSCGKLSRVPYCGWRDAGNPLGLLRRPLALRANDRGCLGTFPWLQVCVGMVLLMKSGWSRVGGSSSSTSTWMPMILTLDGTCRQLLFVSDRLSSAQLPIRRSPAHPVVTSSPHTKRLLQQQVGCRRVWSDGDPWRAKGEGYGSTDATICGMPRCPLTVAAKRSWAKCHCFDWGRPRMARTATRWAGSESVLQGTSGCPCACAVGVAWLAGQVRGPPPPVRHRKAKLLLLEKDVVAPVARLLDDPSGCPLAARTCISLEQRQWNSMKHPGASGCTSTLQLSTNRVRQIPFVFPLACLLVLLPPRRSLCFLPLHYFTWTLPSFSKLSGRESNCPFVFAV
ncbi:hypothetical protein V8C26DRAFT_233548 [Trichoderma gracile]